MTSRELTVFLAAGARARARNIRRFNFRGGARARAAARAEIHARIARTH